MTRLLNPAIHVGIAVDTDDGIIVPVLRNAQDLNLAETDEQLTKLTAAARTRRIAPDMLRGTTISLSNFGALVAHQHRQIEMAQPARTALGVGEGNNV